MLAFISINACIIQKKVVSLHYRNKDNNNRRARSQNKSEGHRQQIMKTSKYNALKEMVLAPYSVSGIRNNSQEKWMLSEILRKGFVHTGYYQGSGRHSKAVDLTFTISAILEGKGIAHETGNDAPRGGVSGNYVKVTMPAFLKEVKKVMAEEAAKREAERKAFLEKQEAQRKHLEWVEQEAAKLDLEPYREEIVSIVNRPAEMTQFFESRPTPTKKETGKVVWVLSHNHKGFNLEVLKCAVSKFNLYK